MEHVVATLSDGSYITKLPKTAVFTYFQREGNTLLFYCPDWFVKYVTFDLTSERGAANFKKITEKGYGAKIINNQLQD